MIKAKIISFLIFLLWLTGCKEQQQKSIPKTEEIKETNLAELELKDSSVLTHIKGQFYKSKPGQLFERTFSDREVKGVDTLVSVEYFNGKLPQDIDPLSFEQLDGWFAKDKNFAYYYRPTSGGMLCIKLDSADNKSFKTLTGQYLYAIDKKHIFKETEILKSIDPLKMKITKDKDGEILRLQSGKTIYTAD